MQRSLPQRYLRMSFGSCSVDVNLHKPNDICILSDSDLNVCVIENALENVDPPCISLITRWPRQCLSEGFPSKWTATAFASKRMLLFLCNEVYPKDILVCRSDRVASTRISTSQRPTVFYRTAILQVCVIENPLENVEAPCISLITRWPRECLSEGFPSKWTAAVLPLTDVIISLQRSLPQRYPRMSFGSCSVDVNLHKPNDICILSDSDFRSMCNRERTRKCRPSLYLAYYAMAT